MVELPPLDLFGDTPGQPGEVAPGQVPAFKIPGMGEAGDLTRLLQLVAPHVAPAPAPDQPPKPTGALAPRPAAKPPSPPRRTPCRRCRHARTCRSRPSPSIATRCWRWMCLIR